MSEPQQYWQYIVDGQQLGPITADQFFSLAQSGDITPETLVWTEGMEDWASASLVEGLFPPAGGHPSLVTGAAADAARPLGVQPAQPVHGMVTPQPQPGVAPAQPMPAQGVPMAAAQPQVGVPGASPYAAPAAAVPLGAVPPGTEYPLPVVKKASFGLWLWTLLGGIGCLILALVFLASGAQGAEEVAKDGLKKGGGGKILLGGLFYLGAIALFIWSGILGLVYLYRAWSCLQHGGAKTTPGKAVGFLFIPFFNIYWLFVAYGQLPKDWNRVMSSYPNLQGATKLNETTFLLYAIGQFFAPLGIVMIFIMMSELCKGINSLASLRLRMQGAGQGLAQPTGGPIRFY